MFIKKKTRNIFICSCGLPPSLHPLGLASGGVTVVGYHRHSLHSLPLLPLSLFPPPKTHRFKLPPRSVLPQQSTPTLTLILHSHQNVVCNILPFLRPLPSHLHPFSPPFPPPPLLPPSAPPLRLPLLGLSVPRPVRWLPRLGPPGRPCPNRPQR